MLVPLILVRFSDCFSFALSEVVVFFSFCLCVLLVGPLLSLYVGLSLLLLPFSFSSCLFFFSLLPFRDSFSELFSSCLVEVVVCVSVCLDVEEEEPEEEAEEEEVL